MAVFESDSRTVHDTFEDLPAHLMAKGVDGLWVNDTKVLMARILATKSTGGQLEVFLLSPFNQTTEACLASTEPVAWKAMVRNAKRWSDGRATARGVGHELTIVQQENAPDGGRVVRLEWTSSHGAVSTFAEVLDDLGKTPLPPYMRRAAEEQDRTNYQTVFAMEPGSVAAPTAGLHYDEELLSSLTKQGLPLHRLTLHVGAGTFKPLSEGEVASHTMHAERCVVTRQALLDMAQQTVRVATGTTTLRTMESLYWWALHWKVYGAWPDVLPQRSPYEELAKKDVELGWSDQEALTAILDHGPWQGDSLSFETQLMIVPGYNIRMVKGLVTNFHQPGSTLLCLVAAFVGMEVWQSLYKECLAQGYRFLSYGDGSLLWLDQSH